MPETLAEKLAPQISDMRASGKSFREIGRELGVSRGTISRAMESASEPGQPAPSKPEPSCSGPIRLPVNPPEPTPDPKPGPTPTRWGFFI